MQLHSITFIFLIINGVYVLVSISCLVFVSALYSLYSQSHSIALLQYVLCISLLSNRIAEFKQITVVLQYTI